MNENEELISIEEGIISVVQMMDKLIEERLVSGEIGTEQYLSLSQRIQAYADEGRNILSILRARSGLWHSWLDITCSKHKTEI
ncbi:MAG: hypothetical protein WBW71_03665 [Bacteroidota bacterium]